MSSREAERKARQRQGFKTLQLEVHLKTFVATLLTEGLIRDGQLEDMAAIREAGAQFIANHCRVGRILRDETEPPKLPARRMSGGCYWSPTNFISPTFHGRVGPWKPGK